MDVVPAALRLLFIAAVIATAACSAPAELTRSAAPLSNTFESPDALAQAVLAALAQQDLPRLRSLALSESEFRDHVWPELDTSRPERNVPLDYAWGQMKQRSDDHLEGTFGRYAGTPLTFLRTRYAGDTTKYATFSVMRDSEIIAADETGRELVLRLYGSAMLKDGRYKVFSFVVDN